MRLGKPAGVAVLYFPCIFGTFYVAAAVKPITAPFDVLKTNLVFLLGSFLVRSLGCTWNDYVDRDFDRLVERTKFRPLPEGSISSRDALIFTFAQSLLGILSVIALQPMMCLFVGAPSIFITAIYPFAKRFTSYPQAILGIPASWGIIMAFPALEVPFERVSSSIISGAICLVVACMLWTVLYDTVYAAQDVYDDLKAGLRSTMTRHLHHARWFLRGLTAAHCVSMIGVQYFFAGSVAFILLSVLGSVMSLAVMIESVDLQDQANCAWWFTKGNMIVGFVMASGFFVEYIQRLEDEA